MNALEIIAASWLACAAISLTLIAVIEEKLTLQDVVGCIVLAPVVILMLIADITFSSRSRAAEAVIWEKKKPSRSAAEPKQSEVKL